MNHAHNDMDDVGEYAVKQHFGPCSEYDEQFDSADDEVAVWVIKGIAWLIIGAVLAWAAKSVWEVL